MKCERFQIFAAIVTGLWGSVAVAGDEAPHASDHNSQDTPHWIWSVGNSRNLLQVELERKFTLQSLPTDGRLRLAADFCRCTVQINGDKILILDDFAPWIEEDVTEHLRPGDNTILLSGVASDGPSAVAAELWIESIDGQRTSVVTDSTWSPGSPGNSADPDIPIGEHRANRVTSRGRVAPHLWNAWQSGSRITAFDDYEQWRQASGGSVPAAPATFALLPGFEIQLLRTAAADEGSWVSMAFDPKGRLTIAREKQGLLRLSFNDEGEVDQVELINDTLLECRGLLYAYDSLYANANNSKGLYRLRDTNGDDRFDEVELLREFPGGVGHGRNDLALGPDGLIYSIHGDSVNLPQDDIIDHTSPLRESRRVGPLPEGHLIRTDKDGQRWELVAAGLRNPFGIDFNADGEPFTYDADAEFDMGAPWYRPTRMIHLVSGADYGWRGLTGQWPPYRLDRPDNALPTIDIGKGSPTAVKSGMTSSFPLPYRDAMFILDWAYGRIVACHLYPRGAGYYGRTETFLKGRPLNVTDLDFGQDGALYFVTGGRGTESSLYRVTCTGPSAPAPIRSEQQILREEHGEIQRALRKRIERFHEAAPARDGFRPVDYLSSPDPVIRHASRVALEHQPTKKWLPDAMTILDSFHGELPPNLVGATLARARTGDPDTAAAVLARLNEKSDVLRRADRSVYNKLSVLQTIELCVATLSEREGFDASATQRLLETWLSAHAATEIGPAGAGAGVTHKLLTLLADVDSPNIVALAMPLLQAATSQQDRMHFLFVLRHAQSGWTDASRKAYFMELRELERNAFAGDGMPRFLKSIRDEATATLSDHEREMLGDLLNPAGDAATDALTLNRPQISDWTTEQIEQLLAADTSEKNLSGVELFQAATCSRCHRFGTVGRAVGPDLTSVASRFSRRDILISILDPSRVVAEKYRSVQVVTTDGKTVIGQVIEGGDYRSSTLRIATDPLDPSKITEIPKSEVEQHQASTVSLMPKGLLNTLTQSEVRSLLDYLTSEKTD